MMFVEVPSKANP
jgi:hypothetical protein